MITTTHYKKILPKIKRDAYYSVTAITDNRFILNTIGNEDRAYVARLVRMGVLKSRNFGVGSKFSFYKVLGQDLVDYINEKFL